MLHYQCEQNRDVPVVVLLNWYRNIKPLCHLLTITLSFHFQLIFCPHLTLGGKKQGVLEIQSTRDQMCKYKATTLI